jgi:hypothetical protein
MLKVETEEPIMSYDRPKYLDPSVKTEKVATMFGPGESIVPIFDTTITPRENFRRAISKKDPIWLPNGNTDSQTMWANDVMGHEVNGRRIHAIIGDSAKEEYSFTDWFGANWTWVPSAGGAMLTPGTQRLADITDWEKEIVWPNLSEWGFEEKADWYLKNVYDPNKALKYDIGRGMTERLVSLTGGYTDGMLALAVEPEAVADFFDRYADFVIELFDKINSLYPLDMITLHDDWGTERDTFFSNKMMEELVFEPTKRVIDHIHSKDVLLEMHSCGNVTRFIPYMIQMDVDTMQIQRRAVDMPAMKAKYGDKIGYCAGVEGVDFGASLPREEYVQKVRESVDIYAPGGGSYISVFSMDPQTQWEASAELYCRSREIYDAERAAKTE